MAHIRIPKGWEIPEREATPEAIYRSRREIIKSLGLGAMSALSIGTAAGCGLSVDGFETSEGVTVGSLDDRLPALRNGLYTVPERPITDETVATTYNNYYEFTTRKDAVHLLTGGFEVEPWTIQIDGLCHNPGTYGFEELVSQFDLEERLYRFRCVERWAMTVPWTGFSLADLIRFADPMGSAKFVSMQTVSRPANQPGLEDRPEFPWPYHEALRIDEAMNELSMIAVAVFGKPLPVQNGAPLRLITPWKYGYKNTKAIVRITFEEERPATFWNTINDREYGFYSNVDPTKRHPRWSQAMEFLIPDGADIRETQLYNGYQEQVAAMYDGTEI